MTPWGRETREAGWIDLYVTLNGATWAVGGSRRCHCCCPPFAARERCCCCCWRHKSLSDNNCDAESSSARQIGQTLPDHSLSVGGITYLRTP